jgi:hypothetical protein
MVATFVWPWKNDDELLEVRSLFYPKPQIDDETRRENQQLAVNIVSHVICSDGILQYIEPLVKDDERNTVDKRQR